MIRTAMNFCLAGGAVALALTMGAQSVKAQVPVTVYYPSEPVVTYTPVRAGLFGQRIAYRPTISYATSVAYAPVTSYYAPTVSYYTPQVSYYAPTVSYYTPTVAAPVTSYYAPATVVSPVTTYYAPAYYYVP